MSETRAAMDKEQVARMGKLSTKTAGMEDVEFIAEARRHCYFAIRNTATGAWLELVLRRLEKHDAQRAETERLLGELTNGLKDLNAQLAAVAREAVAT